MDYIFSNVFSDIMAELFPFAWFIISSVLFGKGIYDFVYKKYCKFGDYDSDAKNKISGIAVVATIIFLLVSCFNITGVSNKIAMDLLGDFSPIPIAIQVLAYLVRCLIALIIDMVFCIATWFFYLRHL